MTKKNRKIIICDTEKCNGCRLCEYACVAYQDKSLNLRHSRIRVVRIEPVFNAAMSCVLCDEPDCVNGCPTQAIVYDKKKKIIVIDSDKCDACGLCIERCKFGSITLALRKPDAFVCDYCHEHDEPQCVKYCPKDALSYKRANEKNFQGMIKKIKEENDQQ